MLLAMKNTFKSLHTVRSAASTCYFLLTISYPTYNSLYRRRQVRKQGGRNGFGGGGGHGEGIHGGGGGRYALDFKAALGLAIPNNQWQHTQQ